MTTWRFETTNSTPVLHGLSNSPSETMAIAFHGSWGNFYENPFALGASSAYAASGIGYASVNNRGHDGGTIDEDLTRGNDDIAAWFGHFRDLGVQRWFLQGHSLGALKVIKAVRDGVLRRDEIAGIILLSPFDLPAFYAGSVDSKEIDLRRSTAMNLAKEQGPEAAVPASLFATWPVSLGTYIAATERGGALDQFRTRENDATLLSGLGDKLLILLGSADFAASPDNTAVHALVQETVPNSTAVLIEDAPHNFAGHERSVFTAIANFVSASTGH